MTHLIGPDDPRWDQDWPNFSHAEMACRHCGKALIKAELLHRLQELRDEISFPLKVTSGYRCQEHNAAVGGQTQSFHLKGMAADILISGARARHVLGLAIAAGFSCGVYQSGPFERRFVHLDIRPEPTMWSG